MQLSKKPALADDTGTPAPPKSAVFSLPEGKRKSIMRDLGIHAATDSGEVDKPSEDLLKLQVEKPQIIEDNKDTRMVISFIKVEIFKSFRGVHEIGPLHKNMNVVAGANGSGKSNVIEAVLFCFGAQEGSARCKNLFEFIHKTDGCERASVQVLLQSGGRAKGGAPLRQRFLRTLQDKHESWSSLTRREQAKWIKMQREMERHGLIKIIYDNGRRPRQ
ncbi:hypothetical protein CAEBREN_08238 [Caenorhabditis brenneri]|uniref:RecF/RecN/SMC N-terminal domain-containing protein n=1 Tax=Caenorhabditis brenneri TaxID=135651 RepID=G0NP70_CAEBE|nr:hypothetical protein CAEBREN_08238 [Caenorhabditis brenneri]